MSRDTCKKQDAKYEGGEAQRHPTNFPSKFANYLAEWSFVAYSFIRDTQFPSFEESTAALPRFLSLLAPLSLSLSHTSPQIPPENCITRRSVGERDNISHARPRYTTKFLAEIYKGRRPGINLARSRNTGKETSLLNVRLPSRIMLTTDFTTLFLSFYFPFFFPLCIKLVNCEHLTMFFLRVFSFLSVYTFRMYIYIYIFISWLKFVSFLSSCPRLVSNLVSWTFHGILRLGWGEGVTVFFTTVTL